MIIRQFCARRGRAVLSSSIPSTSCSHRYVSETSLNPSRRSWTPDDNRVQRMRLSSIVDTSSQASTGPTRVLEKELDSIQSTTRALQGDVNSHAASATARIMSLDNSNDISATATGTEGSISQRDQAKEMMQEAQITGIRRERKRERRQNKIGSTVKQTYEPTTIIRQPPTPETLTLPMLLANQTHLGHATSLWNPSNSTYIFGIRDGIHIIALDTTYAYLQRAAQVVREVARRGGIILFVGTRKGQEEIVVHAARTAKAYHVSDRWTPGTLTNGQQILAGCAVKVVDVLDRELTRYRASLAQGAHAVLRPDLVVCLNPLENEACLHECGLYAVPTIGIIDTDANPTWVTYPIPANDDSFRSVGLIAGVLAQAGREGQKMRLEAAGRGVATYDQSKVQQTLQGLEEIASMDVKDSDPALSSAT